MANNPRLSTGTVGQTRFQQLRSLFEQSGKGETTATGRNFNKIKDLKSKPPSASKPEVKSASSQHNTFKYSEKMQNPSTQQVKVEKTENYLRPQASVESWRSFPTQNQRSKATKDKLSQKITEDDYQPGLRQYYETIVNKTVLDKTVCDNLVSSCILIVEDRETVMKKIHNNIATER